MGPSLPVSYSGLPTSPPRAPAAVKALAGARSVEPVWVNEVGGLTFAVVGADGPELFVKWAPPGAGVDYLAEAVRLAWAGPFTPVPEVVELGRDSEGSWMAMRAIDGASAVEERWRAQPAVAVRAIGEGLRALHHALPADSCPFSWSAGDRAARATQLAASGHQSPERWHEQHRYLSVDQALALVSEPPAIDRLVVCHGDACAPNTLLGPDGRWCAHVDFERLGLADRWADLAIATWSCDWNYGPGWEGELLAAYGVGPDPERSAYYRLLWDLA
jgi:kanamycin kinase